jgi:kynurenine formamidase
MNVHTPGWVGYAGNKMYYAQNLQTQRIVAQRVDMALHVGTHIDGAMHGADGMGDMASYALDFLVSPGVVVDISEHMDDWALITPAMLEKAPVEIRAGDIVIIHTGWHRYWEGSRSRIWCAISACIRAAGWNCCIGCSTRKSNGSAWIPVPAIIP